MIFKDYYKILGLGSNKVSLDQIKLAYRDMAKKFHPDLNVGNRIAEERFKDIGESYKILSNVNTRRKYDKMWNVYIGNKRKKTEETIEQQSDVMQMFFGRNNTKKEEKIKKSPIKGENIETEITVSIKEAFFGYEKKISLRTIDGNMKAFSIKIPAGIRNKEKIRLLGQGLSGKNGGKNGDLLIKISIEDNEQFKLEGYNNLKTDIYISPWEAVLGTRLEIECLEEKVALYISEGTQTGEKIIIPNKGYKDGKGNRGNLIVEIKIMIPKTVGTEEKELFKQLKEISKYNPRKSLHK